MKAPASVEIRECVTLQKGKPPAQQPYYGPDAAWYLTPEYLRGAGVCERVKPSPKAAFAADGDSILLWDGSNAGEVLHGREGALASTMSLASHDERFVPQYFFYALKRWEDYLKGQTSGSGIPHIDKEVLGKLKILDFEKPEQSKIAEVLSTVDRTIAQTEALIAKQQHIKTGLMQDLLTRGIDEHGQLRSEATHRFKDSPLGRIPVEWDVVPVKSLLRNIEGGWSPSCIDEPPGQGEWGVLKVSAVSSGVYQPSESKRLPSSLSPIPALEVQQGDVLLSRANGVTELVGRCAYVENTPNRLLLSDKTLRLQPILTRVDPYILSLLLGVHSSRLQIVASLSGSSGQKNISQAQIHAIQVRLPPLGEQQHLMAVLEKSSNRMRNEKDSLRKLRSIKIALMQDLLTGTVRVTPLLEQAEAATA